MVFNFEYSVFALERLGIVDVILPFIIIFTIIYATLQKTKILGRDSKKFNVVIALVMGLAVVIPHVMGTYPPNGDVVEIMNNALPNVSLVALAFVMVMLIMGIIGGEVNFAGTTLGGIGVFVSIIAVFLIFLTSANVWQNVPWWLNWTYDPYIKELVIVILVFGVIIWFITKEDKGNEPGIFKRGLEDLGNVLGGGKN